MMDMRRTTRATPMTHTAHAVPLTRAPRKTWRRIAMLAVLLVISIVIATGLGPVSVKPAITARVVLEHLFGTPAAPAMQDNIVWLIRLPRVLLATVVGASLAVAGTTLQAATGNRLADPHLLGVSSGASVGAVAATLWTGAALGSLTLPALAFAREVGSASGR